MLFKVETWSDNSKSWIFAKYYRSKKSALLYAGELSSKFRDFDLRVRVLMFEDAYEAQDDEFGEVVYISDVKIDNDFVVVVQYPLAETSSIVYSGSEDECMLFTDYLDKRKVDSINICFDSGIIKHRIYKRV